MEQNKNIITKEGKKRLEEELKILVDIERPKVINEIRDARELGDLSENAEYSSAREKQGKIEDRIREITSILDNSRVLQTNNDSTHKAKNGAKIEKIKIGSKVTLKNLNTKESNYYQIVGTLEADPFASPIPKISNQSPLAQAILNKEKGDKVWVEGHKKYEIQIENIKN